MSTTINIFHPCYPFQLFKLLNFRVITNNKTKFRRKKNPSIHLLNYLNTSGSGLDPFPADFPELVLFHLLFLITLTSVQITSLPKLPRGEINKKVYCALDEAMLFKKKKKSQQGFKYFTYLHQLLLVLFSWKNVLQPQSKLQ